MAEVDSDAGGDETVPTGGGTSWWAKAACLGIDPELFFPEQTDDYSTPRMVCRTCPVWRDCLIHALATNQKFGTWGARSERDRRRLRQRMRRQSVQEIVASLPDPTPAAIREAERHVRRVLSDTAARRRAGSGAVAASA